MKLLDKFKKSKVMKAGLGYTVGNFLLKGINFLTIPIFSRIMSTSDYGIYNTYMAYDSIVTIFIAFALHSSLKSAKYEYKEKFDEYVSSILIIPVLFLLTLLIFVNLFFEPIVNLLDFNRVILNILLCHAFANSVITIYNAKLGIDYRYKNFLKIAFANTILNLSLSIILMLTIFNNEKYLGRILGSVTPLIFIVVFIYWRTFKLVKPKYNKKFWVFGLTYSLPIIPHGLSQVLLSQFDRVMIRSLIGASEAGIYSFAYNINQIVQVLATSLDVVWGPWFFENMDKKNYDEIKKISTAYIYGMFCAISLIILVSPEVIKVMAARDYWSGRYVVIPILMSTFFTFIYTIPAQVEYYYKKTNMIALATMGAAVINVVLNLFFIPRYGYIAAGYTTLASYIFYFIFHYHMAKKIAGKQLFNTKNIIFISLMLVFIGFVAVLLVDKILIRYVVIICFIVINGLIFKKMLKQII